MFYNKLKVSGLFFDDLTDAFIVTQHKKCNQKKITLKSALNFLQRQTTPLRERNILDVPFILPP
jgi:hypothetical protein